MNRKRSKRIKSNTIVTAIIISSVDLSKQSNKITVMWRKTSTKISFFSECVCVINSFVYTCIVFEMVKEQLFSGEQKTRIDTTLERVQLFTVIVNVVSCVVLCVVGCMPILLHIDNQ